MSRYNEYSDDASYVSLVSQLTRVIAYSSLAPDSHACTGGKGGREGWIHTRAAHEHAIHVQGSRVLLLDTQLTRRLHRKIPVVSSASSLRSKVHGNGGSAATILSGNCLLHPSNHLATKQYHFDSLS